MNAAVILETRPLDNLLEIVEGHMKFLSEFELVFFCGNENRELVEKNINVDHLHLLKYSSLSQFEYNLILTNPSFWNLLLDYNRVLIFQHDSKILREGIEEFLAWDYIGAPWKFQHNGGNGGFSLRNPEVMMQTCLKTEYRAIHGNEDVYFSNHLEGKLAPRDVCERFSCETIFKLGTFGVHAIEKYLSKEECEQIYSQYEKKSTKTRQHF